MTIFGFAFSFIEMLFLVPWLLIMIGTCTFDRRGHEQGKWWTIFIGFIVAAGWYWSEWTFKGVKDSLLSLSFWIPVLYFIGIGFVYAIFEFVLEVYRSAGKYRTDWEDYKKRNSPGATKRDYFSNIYLQNLRYNKSAIVKLELSDNGGELTPRVDRAELAASIGAWSTFWPFYLLSLITGDLFTWIYERLAEAFAWVSGRFVKNVFKNVFN